MDYSEFFEKYPSFEVSRQVTEVDANVLHQSCVFTTQDDLLDEMYPGSSLKNRYEWIWFSQDFLLNLWFADFEGNFMPGQQ